MQAILSVILLAFPAAAPATSNPTTLATQLTSISVLIEKLADADPRVRQSAEDRIVAAGNSARPAMLAAWRGGDPRIAPRAARLLLQLPWRNWAITSNVFAFRTAPGAPIASLLKAASTPPRITRTMVIAFTVFFTTRSKEETSARAKPTSIGWRK